MKHIFIPISISILLLGCGVMNNPKEENSPIHLPQKVSIKIPDILIKDEHNSTKPKKSPQQKRWYR